MRDLWLKVNTKWDRTGFKIGHFALPYGHAPKVDLDNSFIPALAGIDLGFNRDMGILFKTPVAPQLDLEVALTMGGSIPSTLISYQFPTSITDEPQQEWALASLNYQGTWLATARLGNPTYNKNEFGVFAALGKTAGAGVSDQLSQIYRIGGDWTCKHKEHFRMTNQLVAGYSQTETGKQGFSFSQKTEGDYFWHRQWILSFSNNLQYQNYLEANSFAGTAVIGLSYALNPHTRIKLNIYDQYQINSNGHQPGAFLQLVAGLGKRG